MSNRELALSIINQMSEEKIVAFLELFADENTVARAETEFLASSPTAPRYSSMEELLKELRS